MIFGLRGLWVNLLVASMHRNGINVLLTTVDDRISDGMEKAGNSRKGKKEVIEACLESGPLFSSFFRPIPKPRAESKVGYEKSVEVTESMGWDRQ